MKSMISEGYKINKEAQKRQITERLLTEKERGSSLSSVGRASRQNSDYSFDSSIPINSDKIESDLEK